MKRTVLSACLCCLILSLSTAAAIDDGLVAHWNFDAGKGNQLADRVGANHGAIHGATWVPSGKGYALKFDGADDYVDCGAGADLDITGPITLQAWVMPTAANRGEPGICGKFFESYALTYYGNAWWYISSGGNARNGPLTSNAWTHVAGTFDGATMTVYINGMQAAAGPSKFKTINHGANFLIGCVIGNPVAKDLALRNTAFFPGLIDDVRLHRRALSPTEILECYNLEAADKGLQPFDLNQLGRLSLEPFFYPDKQTAVLSVNSRWIADLPSHSVLIAQLAPAGADLALQTTQLRPDAPRHEDEAEFFLSQLAPGKYELRAFVHTPEILIQAEHPTRNSAAISTPDTGWMAGKLDLRAGWTEYDIETEAGEYSLGILAARIYDSAGIKCTIDGKQPVEVNLNGTQGGSPTTWQNAKWETVATYNLAAGRHTLRIQTIPALSAASKKTYSVSVYIDAFSLERPASAVHRARNVQRVSFTLPFPASPPPPAPKDHATPPLPAPVTPPAYDLDITPGGGIMLRVKGRAFPLESSYSFPHGGENHLRAGAPDTHGEPTWRVSQTRRADQGYRLVAEGKYYSISRLITRETTRLYIRDTITNKTDDAIGIILANLINTAGLKDANVIIMSNPTIFAGVKDCGVGLIAMDDLYQLQQDISHADGRAAVTTRHFGLDKHASYTIEWAVYPTATADYYDFINQIRKDEGINRRIEGPWSYLDRRNNLEAERKLVTLMGLKYINAGPHPKPEDDPAVSIEGYEFTSYPKFCAATKHALAQTKEWFPDAKVMFHVAHSLYCTNQPRELFGDSIALDSNGKQLMYGPDNFDYYGRYMPRERFDAGWRWWLFYPTMENAFGKMMLERTRFMLDELGATGMWADGFISGYVRSGYTYDRWDGHSVDIDPKTKLITRKKNCVPWVALPVLREVIRMISAKNGLLITNGHPGPRSLWKEDYLTSNETGGGDQRPVGGLYLGRTITPLGDPTAIKNERDIYRDVLRKLDLGALYFWYGGRQFLTRETLVQHMYPITFQSIHAGTVRGAERIITKKSGLYGWPEDTSLHHIRLYDARGALVRNTCTTTVDRSGARTELKLQKNQSAAIVRLPIALQAAAPVNVRVRSYNADLIQLELNGQGRVTLDISHADFAVKPGTVYTLTGAGFAEATADANGLFSIPLNGPMTLSIKPR